jgi:hypothetical protein
MVDQTFTKETPVRVITQPNPNESGTITASSKPIPIVERVGQIYQHPTTRIGEKLLHQEAMRNIANLPDLLEKLQKRLSVLPHQLNATSDSSKTPPTPPAQSNYFTPKTSVSRDRTKTDSSQTESLSSIKGTKKPSAQPKPGQRAQDSISSLSESSSSYEATSSSSSLSSSSKRKSKAAGFIKYLQKIKAVLNENDGQTEVDARVIDDMKEKGFNVPTTRTYKFHKGLHDYITKQITTLSEVLDE